MSALQLITDETQIRNLCVAMPSLLCATDQLNEAGQIPSGANVRCDFEGQGCPNEKTNYCGIEITTSSFIEKGWE